MIACLVTTYNRAEALTRSLPQIAALGAPVLVVDDGCDRAKWMPELVDAAIADYLLVPRNRGLACALNIGLSYWLADSSVEWISCFQDDVDVHPQLMEEMEKASSYYRGPVYTGHDSADHPAIEEIAGVKFKRSCAGVHIHAHRHFWDSVMPIPTFRLGAPMRVPGRDRGIGSNVDWWIVRDAPNSVQRRKGRVVCLPGLVRTFYHRAEDSSWGNAPRCGEDAPLRPARC
jgi:hypothetical protein